MQTKKQHRGAVVPMVTPTSAAGDLDLPAIDRLIDFMVGEGVQGVFVLGTTGEAPSVPRQYRAPFVARAVDRVRGRALVYAGIGDTCLADVIAAGKEYFQLGVDAVVAMPPVYYPLVPAELLTWFQSLLDGLPGPVVLYNIPSTTRVSIPLDILGKLQGHPRLAGFKDSENDAARHTELLARFGKIPSFSIFIGVGSLMAAGMKSGAHGIVPSVGNLVPGACARFCAAADRGDWEGAGRLSETMSSAAAIYQTGRTLGQSLAALKAALHINGLCSPAVFPPLLTLNESEIEAVRAEMIRLKLTNLL